LKTSGSLAPFISVVIPSFNSFNTIENCLRAIAKSDYKNIEIIVVDDCSTDDSPRLVERIELGRPLTLLRQNKNRGPACARNAGARIAKGEYIFFFDSDTEPLPDAIEICMREMKRLEADAITGIYHIDALNPGFVPEYKAFFNHTFFSDKGIIPYEVFDSSRACIKKSVFDELKGFNEDLKWGMDYENEEFGYRLVKKHKIYLVPLVQARHHFPEFKKLTKTYFNRVAYWVEIFLERRQFESGGITTKDIGIGTIFIFPAFIFSPLLCHSDLFWIPLVFWTGYLKTYAHFFVISFKKKGVAIGSIMCGLNMYFSLVISLGAFFGMIQYSKRQWIIS
jgi:glycosyltransferase involved in cell wall biosynthesis